MFLNLKDKVLLAIYDEVFEGDFVYQIIQSISKIINDEKKRIKILNELNAEGYIYFDGNTKQFLKNCSITEKGIERAEFLKMPCCKRIFITLLNFFKKYWQFIVGVIIIGGILPFFKK